MQGLESIQQHIGRLGPAQDGGSGSKLGKDDFLRLLVTQLKNQDPLNPENPAKMTAQLAQYSSVEQLYNVNDNLKRLGDMTASMDKVASLSMLDNRVLGENSRISYGGQPLELGYRLDEPAHSVEVRITDQAGNPVFERTDGQAEAGVHTFQWNGEALEGGSVDPGDYVLQVRAENAEGEQIEIRPLVEGSVRGVDFRNGENVLITESGEYGLKDVVRIMEPTQ